MLKLEYLLEEAKELELPQTKKRAILREYLQTITLNGIYKAILHGQCSLLETLH